jgi:hypothetical protein
MGRRGKIQYGKELEGVLEYLEDAYSFLQDPAIGKAIDEIKRLRKVRNDQANILRRLTPDKFPDTYFVHSGLGEKDKNGMPERLLVCPAYGVDFSYIYEYTGKTTTTEW